MDKYIYLLWSNDEDGPIDLVATDNRENIIPLAKEQNVDGWFERVNTKPIERLESLLLETDEMLSSRTGIHNLMDGWGGLHFQVVKIK